MPNNLLQVKLKIVFGLRAGSFVADGTIPKIGAFGKMPMELHVLVVHVGSL
jgi:hypothetical protein